MENAFHGKLRRHAAQRGARRKPRLIPHDGEAGADHGARCDCEWVNQEQFCGRGALAANDLFWVLGGAGAPSSKAKWAKRANARAASRVERLMSAPAAPVRLMMRSLQPGLVFPRPLGHAGGNNDEYWEADVDPSPLPARRQRADASRAEEV